MIYLYTATPGTGKTCYVVKQLIEVWLKDEANKNRKIYHNINGLKIEGLYHAPDDFRECEDGSIIIYDEAQEIEHYSVETKINPVAKALSKHRHRGFDIHMITQDPALLNKWVLKNVYLHYYLWRPGQSKTVTIYTFARAIVAPTKQDFKSAFDKKLWRFETYYLQFYKSTVLNTSKKTLSAKQISILTTGLIFFCMIAYFIRPLFSLTEDSINHAGVADNGTTEETTITQVQSHDPNTTTSETTQANYSQQNLENRLNYYKDIQSQRELEMYQRRNELIKQHLPEDYEVYKSELMLQVRGVFRMGNKCRAYNTYGDLMTLTLEECQYYLDESGRVHKPNLNMPVQSDINALEPHSTTEQYPTTQAPPNAP